MNIELKNRNNETIFTYDIENNSIKATVIEAINQRISLRGVDLHKADLSQADLSQANLSNANLFEADLSWADLSNADLRYADLRGVDLYNADLNGVNLHKADLRWANLNGTRFNHSEPVLEECKWRISIMNNGIIAIGCKAKSIIEWDIWFKGNEIYSTPRDTNEFKLIQDNYINVRDYILRKD